ncbi:MAG: ribulose-phosphate 3-epimerase [Alkalispirochaetaceae bacterium]
MDILISPSILAADFGALREAAVSGERAGGCAIHVDIMDGHYVHNFSFGIDLIPALKKHLTIPVVAHLEIANPDPFIPDFSAAGADMIVVQEDTCRNLPYTVEAILESGAAAGVGVNPDRDYRKLEAHPHILREIELLIVMGVYPGFGGQRFAGTTIENIETAVALRERHGGSYDIGVDGGVNLETTPRIVAAGANYLIAGSSVYAGVVEENMRALRSAAGLV